MLYSKITNSFAEIPPPPTSGHFWGPPYESFHQYGRHSWKRQQKCLYGLWWCSSMFWRWFRLIYVHIYLLHIRTASILRKRVIYQFWWFWHVFYKNSPKILLIVQSCWKFVWSISKWYISWNMRSDVASPLRSRVLASLVTHGQKWHRATCDRTE